jgi:hypothetical protein
MNLVDFVRPHGNYGTQRETYTSMTDGQYMDLEQAILKELMVEIDGYVESMEYPRNKEEIHRNFNLKRLPEHIRLAMVAELDRRLPQSELLVKFEVYMILINAIGDIIGMGYKQNYDKVLKMLQVDPNDNLSRKHIQN